MVESLKIHRLDVEGIKRVRVARIEPDGAMITIGGKNGAGKSSILDAIEMAIGGKKTIPDEPVNRDLRKARVVVDLGDIVVERTFTKKSTQLVVRRADGMSVKSPQATLDALYSQCTFDPLAFVRASSKDQGDLLRRALGLDFTELDERRALAFETRTAAKRKHKALNTQLESLPDFVPGTPDKAVGFLELADQLASAHRDNSTLGRYNDALAAAKASVVDAKQDLQSLIDHPVEVPTRDIAALQKAMRELEATNESVRARDEYLSVRDAAKNAGAVVESLTVGIEELDAAKASKLDGADFPVDGLGFDGDAPTLNGLPLDQASSAELIRLSVAIGFELNPKLKVLLVRNGEALDLEGRKLLLKLAEEHGGQVWMECVSEDGDGCSVIIEDGELVQGGVPKKQIDGTGGETNAPA